MALDIRFPAFLYQAARFVRWNNARWGGKVPGKPGCAVFPWNLPEKQHRTERKKWIFTLQNGEKMIL